MTPISTAARQGLGWARQEVVDLLADLALAHAQPPADEHAQRVADRVRRLWEASQDDDVRLAVLFQMSAALSGAFDLLGALSPEQHALAVSGALRQHLGAGSAAA